MRILWAAVAAIRPRGHGFDQPIEDAVMRDIQTFLAHLPTPMRLGFPVGLRLLEYGPPIFARKLTRFSNMPVEEARDYLDGFAHAGGLRASLIIGVRTLVFLAFYQHPDVLKSLDIDWAGRAAELTRRRGELMVAP
jgi:hypothetical protein